MLLKVFKGTGPGVILLIALTMGTLWANAFIEPSSPTFSNAAGCQMPLYSLLVKLFGENHLAGVLFSFALVACMAFLLVGFNTSVFFINERTFLPAFFYVLLTSLFRENQVLNPALPGAVFLMIAIIRIMDSYRKPGVAYNFCDAGIFISLGTLFYSDLIWFGIIIFIGILMLRTISFLELFGAITGLVTPVLITTGIFFVLDMDPAGFLSGFFSGLFSETGSFDFQKLTILLLIITGIIILVSMFHLLSGINSKKIKSRKTFNLLLWILVLALSLFFAIPSISVEINWILAIPASYVLTHFFVFTSKRMVTGIVFTVYFLLILLMQILYFF